MRFRRRKSSPWRSRLRKRDLASTSMLGLRSRPGRTALTAIGIAIGIGSMVAVIGISSSSKAALLAELDAFGTNLLQVQPGSTGRTPKPMSTEASVMLERIPTVTESASMIDSGLEVKRNKHDKALVGIMAHATSEDLFDALKITMASGRFLDRQTESLPVAVLGNVAAERLGITSLRGGPTVSIDGKMFAVTGIMDPLPLHPDVDRFALIGDTAANELLNVKLNPTTIYVRLLPDQVTETQPLLARTADPITPNRVQVSRPSDLLEARAQVDKNLQNLLLALGGVALLVGAVGIANVMVISVLERRGEIGLRRALGASRGHIRSQFVLEAAALSGLGGLFGVTLGGLITFGYAKRQDWVFDLPLTSLAAGVGAALLIGVLAGFYPAAKAARMDPALAVSGGTQ